MAKQRHGRHHPHECLAVKGEDRQEEDGFGMKMEGMQLVMVEDGLEEIREGGNQSRDNAAHEEGVEGASQSFWLGGASPELGLPLLVVLPRRQ